MSLPLIEAVEGQPGITLARRQHGSPIEAGTVPQESVRVLSLQFTDWCLWYGTATERWWALSPTWCRQQIGLIEADTLGELVVRMQQIESCRPHLDPNWHSAFGVRRTRPRPRTDHEVAFPVPQPRSLRTEIAIEGSDEDGGATPGHARQRVH
jgi:hypothetical protein